MKRAATWEADLAEWAHRMRGQPFNWGETDCVSLVRYGLGVLAGEGYDPVPDLEWGTLAKAKKLLRRTPLPDYLGQVGAVVVPEGPAFAQGGDILLMGADPEVEGLPAVALCVAGAWLTSSVGRGVELHEAVAPEGAVLYRVPLTDG